MEFRWGLDLRSWSSLSVSMFQSLDFTSLISVERECMAAEVFALLYTLLIVNHIFWERKLIWKLAGVVHRQNFEGEVVTWRSVLFSVRRPEPSLLCLCWSFHLSRYDAVSFLLSFSRSLFPVSVSLKYTNTHRNPYKHTHTLFCLPPDNRRSFIPPLDPGDPWDLNTEQELKNWEAGHAFANSDCRCIYTQQLQRKKHTLNSRVTEMILLQVELEAYVSSDDTN